jgi:hypothetical protein
MHLAGETEEKHEKLSEYAVSMLTLNADPSEYEAGV